MRVQDGLWLAGGTGCVKNKERIFRIEDFGRAFAVRDAIKAAGVAEDKIELKKPEQMTGTGDASAARRVEVVLQ